MATKKKQLVAAQIGCGKFSWAQDFPNLSRHPQLRLKWACDVQLDRAQAAAKHFGVPEVTDDFMAIVKDPEVDLIKIATTHEVHLPIIEAAAQAGKHIFCEKPMAMHDDEAYRIMQAVRTHQVKLCVDLNRRMAPALQALKKAWQAQVAAPRHSAWRYMEQQRPMLPEEDQTHLLIRIQDESASYGLGHLNPLTGGGEIIGESVHWLDLACWFFAPQRPVEITAWGSSRLSHGIHLKFSGGDSMTLTFSCFGTFDYPKELFEVTAKASLMRSLFFVENNYYGIPGAVVETFPMQHYSGKVKGEGFDAYLRKYQERTQAATQGLKQLEQDVPFLVDKGHKHMLDAFVQAILLDQPSPCDELDGFISTYLAQRAIESIELRQTLPIPVEKITPCIGGRV